jgi:hypothetical protein
MPCVKKLPTIHNVVDVGVISRSGSIPVLLNLLTRKHLKSPRNHNNNTLQHHDKTNHLLGQ